MSMKSNGKFLTNFGFLLLTACAAYEPAPLTTSHPAHLDAVNAPARLGSQTLAYTRGDIPMTQPLAVAQEGGREPSAPGAHETVVGEGKVIATVPNASQIVVEHGEIKGFMDAMTMGYRVDPPSLLERLKSGDKVRFTIDVPKKAIIKIEKVN